MHPCIALTPFQRLCVPHASLMVLDGGLGVIEPAAAHVAPVHLVTLPKLRSGREGEGWTYLAGHADPTAPLGSALPPSFAKPGSWSLDLDAWYRLGSAMRQRSSNRRLGCAAYLAPESARTEKR